MTVDNANLDAYCMYWEAIPFVFLNTTESGERGRFDAAHELGHLALNGEYVHRKGPLAEQQANRFAAALLMPKAGILAQRLRNAHAQTMLAAKKRWGVSSMTLAHRANELSLMTELGYRSTCIDLSRQGYRRGEPGGIDRESSQLLIKALKALHFEGSGIGEISADLGLSPKEVREHMFGLVPTTVDGGGQGTPSRADLRIV